MVVAVVFRVGAPLLRGSQSCRTSKPENRGRSPHELLDAQPEVQIFQAQYASFAFICEQFRLLIGRCTMTKTNGIQASRTVQIDGSECSPYKWKRFSLELTKEFGGRHLYQKSILNNHVSCSIAGPTTHRDVIMEIARQSHKPIRIASLPNEMKTLFRGAVIYGFSGNQIDKIARNYDGLHWWMSARGLNMGVLKTSVSAVLPFDRLAGRLMYEAWSQRLSNGRIPATEYSKICTALDHAGFRPIDYLKGEFRKDLAQWNQKHPREPILSFQRLYNSKLRLGRRGILRRLNRAQSVWIRTNNIVRTMTADNFVARPQP